MPPQGAAGADLIPGSLASLDSTLPPTPLKDLLAADGASVYVLSFDADLVQAVQQAGGDQYPVNTVGDWQELVETVRIGRSRIVLLDADAVSGELGKALAELQRDGGSLVILVAARREEAQGLMGLLSDRQIHRLLIKPAALGITRLLLESAVSRYLQLRESAADAAEPLPEPRRRKSNPSLPAKWPAWLVATALVSVLLGAMLVGGLTRLGGSDGERQAVLPEPSGAARAGTRGNALPGDGTEPASATTGAGAAATSEPAEGGAAPGAAGTSGAASGASTARAPGAAPAEQGASAAGQTPDSDDAAQGVSTAAAPGAPSAESADSAAELLRLAELAAAEGRLSRPVGDSALDYYAAIVSQGFANAEASAQLDALLDTLFGQAEAALLEGSLDTAEAALTDIRRVQASSGRLAFLDAQLESARLSAGSGSAGSDAVDEELGSLLTIGRTRLERGQLLTPDGDSARAYLDRAAALRPDDQAVLTLRADLAAEVVAAARLAISDGDVDRGAMLAEQAFELGADREALTLLDLILADARQSLALERQAELLDGAIESLRQDRLVAPEGDNALYYLSTLRTENPNYLGLAEQWLQFTSAVAGNARAAIAAADWDGAATWTQVLDGAAVDAALVETLEYERVQARYLATPAPASALRLIESSPQAYPEDALRSELEGWVDVDFIVGTDGRTRSISVLDSQPGDRFNAAAIDTVASQRYEPFEQDGRVYERRLQVRIRFTIE